MAVLFNEYRHCDKPRFDKLERYTVRLTTQRELYLEYEKYK